MTHEVRMLGAASETACVRVDGRNQRPGSEERTFEATVPKPNCHFCTELLSQASKTPCVVCAITAGTARQTPLCLFQMIVCMAQMPPAAGVKDLSAL